LLAFLADFLSFFSALPLAAAFFSSFSAVTGLIVYLFVYNSSFFILRASQKHHVLGPGPGALDIPLLAFLADFLSFFSALPLAAAFFSSFSAVTGFLSSKKPVTAEKEEKKAAAKGKAEKKDKKSAKKASK
jgi:hypothetical protein